MGTHGRTGLSHVFLGSVAEKVLRFGSVSRVSGPPTRLCRGRTVKAVSYGASIDQVQACLRLRRDSQDGTRCPAQDTLCSTAAEGVQETVMALRGEHNQVLRHMP